MLKIHVEEYSDVGEFLEYEKTKFFTAIVDGIHKGFKNKLDSVLIAEFHIDEGSSIVSITIEEEDWDESLTLALDHFEKEEDFERCVMLKQLINDIG